MTFTVLLTSKQDDTQQETAAEIDAAGLDVVQANKWLNNSDLCLSLVVFRKKKSRDLI